MTLRQIKAESVKVAAFGVIVIGMVNLGGHVAGAAGLYIWSNNIGMALPTSIALSLIGYCIIILANTKHT